MKQLAIFDLDGTLLNTIDDLGQAANYALAQMGFPTHHISAYPHFVGNGITRLIERVMPADARDSETVAQLRKIFISYYDQHLCDNTQPYPGIHDLLLDLQADGIALAVASNKYQKATTTLINHFFPDIPWVMIAGQNDGIPVKPDPSIIFSILLQHPCPKANIVMIGDSAVDITTAQRAGIDSIAVTWGFRSQAELTAALPSAIVDSPAQLLTAISTLPS